MEEVLEMTCLLANATLRSLRADLSIEPEAFARFVTINKGNTEYGVFHKHSTGLKFRPGSKTNRFERTD